MAGARRFSARALAVALVVWSLLLAGCSAHREPAGSSELDAFIDAQASAEMLPGLAVVVIQHGRQTYRSARGTAGNHPLTLQTPVLLGSTSKQFTGLAVQALIAQGRLSLGTQVRDVLPDVVAADAPVGRLSVRELLGQTSGLSTATGLQQWGWRLSRPASIRADAALVAKASLDRSPGDAFEYSNSNYDLLGAIIEKVTGRPYAVALDSLVLRPMGLQGTTASEGEARGMGLADGYYTWFGRFNLPTPTPRLPGAVPSSGVASSADDLARVVEAHLGTITTGLPDAVLSAARAPLTRASLYAGYASGWYTRPLWEMHPENANWDDPSLPACIEHDGATNRSMSYLIACPSAGFGLVALTDVGPGPDPARWSRFTDRLVHAALGTPPPAPQIDPVTSRAGAIMLGVLAVQAASLVVLARSVSNRRLARLMAVVALAVGVGALLLAWVYAPNRGGEQSPLGAVWDGAPDLALSTVVTTLLALLLAAMLARVISASREVSPRPSHDDPKRHHPDPGVHSGSR